MRIDYLVIGAQRCATGWLAQCLREHPELFMAPDETRFFDRHFEKGFSWWKETYFREYSGEKAIGEKTANYLNDKDVPSRIYEAFPNVKLICSLRNPVDRLYSAYMMKARTRPELKRLTLKELIEQEPDLIERGKYSEQIKRYLEFFPIENLLVLLYEEKNIDPLLYIKKVYEYIGVDSSFVPASLELQTKPGAFENKYPLLAVVVAKLLKPGSPFRNSYNWIRGRVKQEMMSCEDREFLIEVYRSEIDSLEKLLGLNFSLWKKV